jgi:hypothetical protein
MGTKPDLPQFDTLIEWHERDPESFDRYRKNVLIKTIRSAPLIHQQALWKTFHQIQDARATAASPVQAATKAFLMMSDSACQLLAAIDDLQFQASALGAGLLIEKMKLKTRLSSSP